MSRASRDKGLSGEREVRHAFEASGFPVRGLEGLGDHLVVCGAGVVLHLEVKRAETLRLPAWSRQAESESPADALPLVVYRSNREPWRASILLEDMIRLLPRSRMRELEP